MYQLVLNIYQFLGLTEALSLNIDPEKVPFTPTPTKGVNNPKIYYISGVDGDGVFHILPYIPIFLFFYLGQRNLLWRFLSYNTIIY